MPPIHTPHFHGRRWAFSVGTAVRASTQEAQTLLLTAFVRSRVQDRVVRGAVLWTNKRPSASADGAIFVWRIRGLAEDA